MSTLPPNPNDGVDYGDKELKTITLAGGCFWGTQAYIRRLPGVAQTVCGYANGTVIDPTYELVCTGTTGHAEAVQVRYDPQSLPPDKLLDEFFRTINPTSLNRQGGDIGSQYRTGIYYADSADRDAGQAAIDRVQLEHERTVVTELEPLRCFYPAEEYHQDYLEKNPGGYCHVDLGKLNGK